LQTLQNFANVHNLSTAMAMGEIHEIHVIIVVASRDAHKISQDCYAIAQEM
jgi:hypothetical protein